MMKPYLSHKINKMQEVVGSSQTRREIVSHSRTHSRLFLKNIHSSVENKCCPYAEFKFPKVNLKKKQERLKCRNTLGCLDQ